MKLENANAGNVHRNQLQKRTTPKSTMAPQRRLRRRPKLAESANVGMTMTSRFFAPLSFLLYGYINPLFNFLLFLIRSPPRSIFPFPFLSLSEVFFFCFLSISHLVLYRAITIFSLLSFSSHHTRLTSHPPTDPPRTTASPSPPNPKTPAPQPTNPPSSQRPSKNPAPPQLPPTLPPLPSSLLPKSKTEA